VSQLIPEELTPNLHTSLISQYYPNVELLIISNPKLGRVQRRQSLVGGLSTWTLDQETRNALSRPITPIEYQKVLDAFHDFGFFRGWLQDHDCHYSYRPDFSKKYLFGAGRK
jgi:hypothetical protein